MCLVLYLCVCADQWLSGKAGTARPAGPGGYSPSVIARYSGNLHPSNQHLDRDMEGCGMLQTPSNL